MKIEEIIKPLKLSLEALQEQHSESIKSLYDLIEPLINIQSEFDQNWVGSWASQSYNHYEQKKGKTYIYTTDDILNYIEEKSGNSIETIKNSISTISKDYRAFHDSFVTDLSIIKGNENLLPEERLLEKIECHKWGYPASEYVKSKKPKQVISNDMFSLLNKGLDVPPHIEVAGKLVSLFSILASLEDFSKNANRIIRQLELKLTLDLTPENTVNFVINLIESFHKVARQLRNRHDSRETLTIKDEYDVQDLFHALLRIEFDDVRAEEYTPSYAGSSTRVDFLLKDQQTVIEIKMTRNGLNDKKIGEQLILDVQHYKVHPDCKRLICFVYDPENRVTNPIGLENDLNQQTTDDFIVEVYIRP